MEESGVNVSIIKEEKQKIRREINAKFKLQCNVEIVKTVHSLQEDASYCKNLLGRISSYETAKTVFGYVSTDVEFPTWQILKQILKDGKTLALPRVDGRDLQFCQVQLEDGVLPLQKGAFNIMEPQGDTQVLFPQTHEKLKELLPLVVLVPGRAFSLKAERLGYGGGFYDRFFSSLFSCCDRSFVSLVGLCFSFQILPRLICDKYDVLVDEVVTE